MPLFTPANDAAQLLKSSRKDRFREAIIANLMKSGQGKGNPQTGWEAAGRVAQNLTGLLLGKQLDDRRGKREAGIRDAFGRVVQTGNQGVLDPKRPVTLGTRESPLSEGQVLRGMQDDLESTGEYFEGVPSRADVNTAITAKTNYLHDPGTPGAFSAGFKRESKEYPELRNAGAAFGLEQLKMRQAREAALGLEREKKKGSTGFKEKQRLIGDTQERIARLKHMLGVKKENNAIFRKGITALGAKEFQFALDLRMQAFKNKDAHGLAKANGLVRLFVNRMSSQVVTPQSMQMVAGLKGLGAFDLARFLDNTFGGNSSKLIPQGSGDSSPSAGGKYGLNPEDAIGGPSAAIPNPNGTSVANQQVGDGMNEMGGQNPPGGPNPPGGQQNYFSGKLNEGNPNRDPAYLEDQDLRTQIGLVANQATRKKIDKFVSGGYQAEEHLATINIQANLSERLSDSGLATGMFADARVAASKILLLMGVDFNETLPSGKPRYAKGMTDLVRGWLGDSSDVAEAEALRAMENAMALKLRKPSEISGGLTGHTSDRDVRLLLDQVIGLTKTHKGNMLLAEIMGKFASRRILYGLEAEAWRNEHASDPKMSDKFNTHMQAYSKGQVQGIHDGKFTVALWTQQEADKMTNKENGTMLVGHREGQSGNFPNPFSSTQLTPPKGRVVFRNGKVVDANTYDYYGE